MPTKVKYNDIGLFLLLIPLISGVNYYLSYVNIQFNSFFILTFTIDTLQGYVAWLCIRAVILYLDNKIDFLQKPLKRIPLQLILTSATGLAIIIATTELLNAILRDTPVNESFYKHDIFLFLIWFLVINGIYIAIYFYRVWQSTHLAFAEDKKIKEEGFMVKTGNSYSRVSFEDIAGFFVDESYVMLLATDGKEHVVDFSLEKIEKMLPPEYFFRLNRQAIVDRKIISGYRKGVNGKLSVTLSIPHPEKYELNISRTKAPVFKEWFEQGFLAN